MINNDTICAIASALGGAISMIRVSGSNANSIVNSIFTGNIKGRGLYHGNIIKDSEVVDEVMVLVYCAPSSYTGEDTIEICCHGSRYIAQQIILTLIDCGCRQAEPGEFTKRAFLNGKMNLSQAEAVADLIASTNKATHDIAMSQMRGNFSSELASLRNQLLKLTSLIELELDFSEEDVSFANRKDLYDIAKQIQERITSLTDSFKVGNALKEGVAVAIVGKTNVGKSTLLNVLLNENRAIVSNIHGTTRDCIDGTCLIHNITFRFIDTAGMRNTDDEIEKIGIERTYKELNKARIVLWLVDTRPQDKEVSEMRLLAKDKKLIVIKNKIDINDGDDFEYDVTISAKHKTNIDVLKELIFQVSDIPEIHANDIIVTNARHYACLKDAESGIEYVIRSLHEDVSPDLLSEDLRYVIHALSDIIGGEITPQETLNSIFSDFCIGK